MMQVIKQNTFMTLGWERPAIGHIWNYALQNNATIITKDEDFVSLISVSLISVQSGTPSVIWVRVGNTGKQALLNWIEPMMERIVAEIESGEKLIEIA